MRLMLSSRESALRMNRCTALIQVRLPAGFHALPVEEQRRTFERAAERGVQDAIDKLPAA